MQLITLAIAVASFLPLMSGLTFTDCPFDHLQQLESSVSTPASGMDGVLVTVLSVIGTGSKTTFIDINPDGVQHLNILQEIFGFTSLLPDNTALGANDPYATLADINMLLLAQQVPPVFDVLSVRYGMATWWILALLLKDSQHYRPRVIVAEVNSMLGCSDEVSE